MTEQHFLTIPQTAVGISLDRAAVAASEQNTADFTGLRGGCLAPFLIKYGRRIGKTVIIITVDTASARTLHRDLVYHFGGSSPENAVLLFPAYDLTPYDEMIPERRFALLRAEAAYKSAMSKSVRFIVVSADTIARRMMPKEAFLRDSFEISFGNRIDRDLLFRQLERCRYYRTPLVEEPGTFAARGSLLDIFPPDLAQPVRIDFFGSEVERIREFDSDTQLGGLELESVNLYPIQLNLIPQEVENRAVIVERLRNLCDSVNQPSTKTSQLIDDILGGKLLFSQDRYLPAYYDNLETLFDYFPCDSAYVLENPGGIRRTLTSLSLRYQHEYERLKEDLIPAFGADKYIIEYNELENKISTGQCVKIHGLSVVENAENEIDIQAESNNNASIPDVRGEIVERLSERLRSTDPAGKSAETISLLAKYLKKAVEDGYTVVLVAHTIGQTERLASMLKARGITIDDNDDLWTKRRPGIRITEGELARGCILPADALMWIAEEEIFGRRIRSIKSKGKSSKAPLENLRTLNPGDLVVHLEHGIGKYEGLVRKQIRNSEMDFLLITYRDGDKLYLPVYRLNQVQKYRGGDCQTQTLDRLGGQTFQQSLTKAKKAAKEIAGQLITLYAQRATASKNPIGNAITDDLYREFEASFPFEETDDQAKAIDETVSDLNSSRPMDRLVCGDVGFGKTEVAMRAAFLSAMAAGQVAVLAPTTVLAQQHYQTFSKRFAPYPFRIEMLSRFRTTSQNQDTVRAVKEGKVDIVIGTHRLLSKDVHFHNLKLLIIDEEHRFGVVHKERIRSLRAAVDTLTLTATPIPRTLQMAFGGIRDLSLIATAPAERRPIKTMICLDDSNIMKRAIEHELSRGGQVFFVHNRVRDIYSIAEKVQGLAPQATVGVGHGQLKEAELEQIMLDFVAGKYQILVCTSIIESGLDIPNANTIIINRADMFGMAQLYQLRGRVGRSGVQAYAYLIIPPASSLSEEARERVETLARYTELGSGFSVATMDMEIRGAGNLIGAEQSGNVAAVGLEMFCDLLEQAAADLRGEPIKFDIEPELTLEKPGYLPEEYIPDVERRLEFYKRLASSYSEEEVENTAADLRDRFGPLPAETLDLIQGMEVKAISRRLRIRGVEVKTKELIIHLASDTNVNPDAVIAIVREDAGRVRLNSDLTLRVRFKPEEDGGVTGAIHFLHRLEAYGNNLAIS